MAQIEIKDLTFSYSGSNKNAIESISASIEKGQFIVLCGKSGSGKSTLLRCLKPIIRPAGKIEGQVLFNGKDIEKVSSKKQAEKIAFVLQNPEHQIVSDKVWHELALGLENLGYEKEDIRARVAEVSEYFGITDWYYENIYKLSGGQKQLLNLASVMTMYPEVMILDEPTAQLNPIAAEKFIEALRKINRELGITIIISEHRLNNLLHIADKVIVMEEGKMVQSGAPKEVAKLDGDVIKLMPEQVQLFRESSKKGEIPLSIRQGRKWINSLGIKGKLQEPQKHEQAYTIECKNLWFRYDRDGKDILQGLDLQIKKGEIFALLGGNGTGKTTTLSLLSGINKPYRGKVQIKGKTAALPQDVQTLFLEDTVEKVLENVSEEIIELMELKDFYSKHPYDLSGGEQQKLGMAKVLATGADILFLDEPTKGLDGLYKEKLGELLEKLKKEGKTIIIVSHDVDFCGEYADRCGLFAWGNIVNVNNFRRFFTSNRFYTTTVSKMAGDCIEGAIKKEDVLCFLK